MLPHTFDFFLQRGIVQFSVVPRITEYPVFMNIFSYFLFGTIQNHQVVTV